MLLVLAVAFNTGAADFSSVVIVSIDALHPDALTEKNAPLTLAFLKNGSLSLRGESTTPPKTLIAHAAMMTGKVPGKGGHTSNVWQTGEPTVQDRTIFHEAKERNYRTGYFYSKEKLGFLNSQAIDVASLSTEDSIGQARRFLEAPGQNFAFIHISGLDIVGPEHGWLSSMYCEELSYIDQYLEEIYDLLKRKGNYLLVVTSDHGGYGTSHGGSHPEESRLPFGVVSDKCKFPAVADAPYSVSDLPGFIDHAMDCAPREN